MGEKVTIQDQLDELLNSKLDMKTVLNSFEEEVTDETVFREYPDYIQNVIDKTIVPYSDLEDTIELAMDVNDFKPVELIPYNRNNILELKINNYDIEFQKDGITCRLDGFYIYYRSINSSVATAVNYSQYESGYSISSTDGVILFCPVIILSNSNSSQKTIKVEYSFLAYNQSYPGYLKNFTISAETSGSIPWTDYDNTFGYLFSFEVIDNNYYFTQNVFNNIKDKFEELNNINYLVTILS